MKFTLEIELENDTMCRPHDVAESLRRVTDSLSAHSVFDNFEDLDPFDRKGEIRDDNGNKVGEWSVK